ncbi:hypothetical protein [Arthrobacter sp. UM1]|uniref:hypothetical protein n=1 Tax=Arthrobacter sp. UM1 TaxID=2766776 RepID=UPI001CF64816|nr:hypothetical protein [Arthrobacter sp. UM1]MCB4207232.1 hypothetical protein [Arthrobacter sp. UM1]
MAKYLLQYVLGGVLAWFLIGWGLDALFGMNFLKFVGLAVGIAGGIYMAKLRQQLDEREAGPSAAEKQSSAEPDAR